MAHQVISFHRTEQSTRMCVCIVWHGSTHGQYIGEDAFGNQYQAIVNDHGCFVFVGQPGRYTYGKQSYVRAD